ncbi:MAG TPA: FtsX-like permease family protein [Solirubrobacteraceae bacterium]
MSALLNPRIFGVRLSVLAHLYRRRLRAHPVGELLAGAGVAIGVALVFGVLLANASLESSASQLVHGLTGSARFALVARSSQGFEQRLAEEAGNLPGVQVAAPVLRENVTLIGPRGEQEAVQLIGVSPSVESLGGSATQQYASTTALLQGGVGLPTGVAGNLGVGRGASVGLASNGQVRTAPVKALLGGGVLGSASSSPVAVAVLTVAQRLAGTGRRVSEVLIEPAPGKAGIVAGELRRLAAGRLDVRPADYELGLLGQALEPSRQSTSLFSAISVMIGFLLALTAMLLTVPERRRFIAELRMRGYEPRQIVLLLGFQALALGVVASLVGVGAGELLSHALFQRTPSFLSAAFPIGTEVAVHPGMVLIAIAAGVLATALASLSPLLDLRSGRPADAVFRERGSGSEIVSPRTIGALALAGVALIALVVAIVLLAPGATVVGGVALALALLCLIPLVFAALARVLSRIGADLRSSALPVVLAELRATTTRSVALAGIVGIAVYGAVAIGGARDDLLRGISQATTQYFSSAQIWVTSGRDIFNTDSFAGAGPATAVAHVPGVVSVRVYRGGLLDVGERRMWVRGRPAGDSTVIESSQLRQGNLSSATRLIGQGTGVAVSSDYSSEHRLKVGSAMTLGTPSGPVRFTVAAITTNSGWPAGAITMSSNDYSRYWMTADAAALEVSLQAGSTPAQGRRAVAAALASYPGLQVRTMGEREALSNASAREGLRTLGEISTLLLIAAALAVAAALSATISQRRRRLAAMKMRGYDSWQLWRAVLLESAFTIGVGAVLGAAVGVCGHALASRFLERTTGFPAPFSIGPLHVLLTLGLIMAIALVVIALPGMRAARVSPKAILQE